MAMQTLPGSTPNDLLLTAVKAAVEGHRKVRPDYSTAELRSEILAGAKAATVGYPGDENIPLAMLWGIFHAVAEHAWSPMDDRKAERFYAVVENSIDHFLAIPDLAGKVEMPSLRDSLAALGDHEGGVPFVVEDVSDLSPEQLLRRLKRDLKDPGE